MATIRPFKAIRPTPQLASKVAALPYDVMSSQEAKEIVKDNPYSFLHVDKAEVDLENIDLYDEKVYLKAKENLENLIKNGTLIEDNESSLFIYKLQMQGRTQTGIVACASVDEYLSGIIKKHELTRQDKELDRTNHIKYTNAHTGPIFLLYKKRESISNIIENFVQHNEPVYNFESEDNVLHMVWKISNTQIIEQITSEFASVESLYIADGHHRNASAVNVALERNSDLDESKYYLSVIFPHDQLKILDYNRIVKDLNGLTANEFLAEVSKNFTIHNEETFKGTPLAAHTFGMYLDGKWSRLLANDNILKEKNVIKSLDVSILQDYILTPILGICDIRTNKRIDFVGGIRGITELEKRVDSGEFKVAFAMFPTTVEELMEVCDISEIMPPKSTWFEPKLRSGLFVHRI